MSNFQLESKKKSKIIYLILLILFLIFAGLLFKSYFFRKNNAIISSGNFFEEKNKHGFATFKSGIGEDNQIEFWFSDQKYRLTWFRPDGSKRIHMICPDGKRLYFSEVDKKETKLAYINPIMHFSIFNGLSEYKNKSENEEDGYQITTYEIDQLWDIEGADQKFYLKDLTVYRKNDNVEKIIARTSSKKPDSEDKLTTSVYTIKSVDYPSKIDSKIFDFPYPLNNQE
ncbi:MAG: hypothetical protein PHX34_05680 [Candidatus Shapirobacteria bacterium]|nr:hypothetical protein [Candidatus Shapirobacteria bacterium]